MVFGYKNENLKNQSKKIVTNKKKNRILIFAWKIYRYIYRLQYDNKTFFWSNIYLHSVFGCIGMMGLFLGMDDWQTSN